MIWSMTKPLIELADTILVIVNENSYVWKRIVNVLGGLSAFFILAVCNYFKRILGLDHYLMHPVASLENLYICMYWPIDVAALL